jgi:hypothetical protein
MMFFICKREFPEPDDSPSEALEFLVNLSVPLPISHNCCLPIVTGGFRDSESLECGFFGARREAHSTSTLG